MRLHWTLRCSVIYEANHTCVLYFISLLQPFCELSGLHLVNVARWQPAKSGEGGVCVGTQQGGVVWWGSRQSQLGKDEELTRRCRLDWFPKSTHKHLQS